MNTPRIVNQWTGTPLLEFQDLNGLMVAIRRDLVCGVTETQGSGKPAGVMWQNGWVQTRHTYAELMEVLETPD